MNPQDCLISQVVDTFLRKKCKWNGRFRYLSAPNYDVKKISSTEIPELPDDFLRILIISDTHDRHNLLQNLPPCDILVHCGDILLINRYYSETFSLAKLRSFNEWLETIPAKHRFVIGGNHDQYIANHSKDEIQAILTNCKYLINESFEVEGLSFWATPLSRGHSPNKAFQSNAFYQETINAAPSAVDVLITHGQCHELESKVSHKIHLWGHAHNAYGVRFPGQHLRGHPIVSLSISASIMDAKYSVSNKPIILDVPKSGQDIKIPVVVRHSLIAEEALRMRSFIKTMFHCFPKLIRKDKVTPESTNV